MVTVLGPTPPQKRFPRGRYIRQLLELERQLEAWHHSYAVQGIENRAELLYEVVDQLRGASDALMQLKSK